MRTIVAPDKTQTPLVVDPDAVLAFAITGQWFESIAWRLPQIVKPVSDIERGQFSSGNASDLRWEALGNVTTEDNRGGFPTERPDHP